MRRARSLVARSRLGRVLASAAVLAPLWLAIGCGGGGTGGSPPAGSGVYVAAAPGVVVEVTAVTDDILRVRYAVPSATAAPERGWTLAQPLPAGGGATLAADDLGAEVRLRTGRLEVRVRKADAALRFLDLQGRLLGEDRAPPGPAEPRRLRKAIGAGERFYGFGEKTGPLVKNGRRMEMWTTDVFAMAGRFPPDFDPLYQAVPFFLALRDGQAYGVYVNGTCRTTFDVGRTVPGELLIETAGGAIDYFFIGGPLASDVVERFTSLVGRTHLPPLWALGYHQSRWGYRTDAEVRDIAAQFRSRRIPCDSLWLDIDHMREYRTFTWDGAAFPDPAGLVADLARSGFKTITILDPGIKVDPGGAYAAYDTGIAGGHFVSGPGGQPYVGKAWPPQVVFPDFTRAATRDWWAGLVAGWMGTGLGGVMIDMNEPTSVKVQGVDDFPLDAAFDGDGRPADLREARNVYALLMARATREGLERARPGERPFLLSRSGFAGIQRHAAVWTGDVESTWEHLAQVPAMLMGMGLSGVTFAGSDVGGYYGAVTEELYTRWMQVGMVSPFFRAHCETSSTPKHEPWVVGPSAEAASKRAIELRYRLLPYLYSLVRQAAERGTPVLRPLFCDAEFQPDTATWDISDESLLGPFLLAAPVLEEFRGWRSVYLPAGTWIDFRDGKTTYAGGTTVRVAAPIDGGMPLFVRAGAILPMAPVVQWVGQAAPQELTLDLYPAAGAPRRSFELCADDGATEAWRQGAVHEVTYALESGASGASLTIGAKRGGYAPSWGRLLLQFHGVGATPTAATLGGAALPPANVAGGAFGWAYDAAAKAALVRIAEQPAGTVVSCAYDAAQPAVRMVEVQLDVTIPACTGSTVCIGADLFGWDPAGPALARTGPTQASTVLTLPEGLTVQYKYTRGLWLNVETTSGNRALTVQAGGGGRQVVTDAVPGWVGACP